MRVISATHDNMHFLNDILQKNKAVVFFVAPWCGHCKALEPTLNKLMGRFSTSRRDGLIARVPEGEIKNLNGDTEIRGFPTIRILNNGKKEKDYEGSRDEKSLSEFLASVLNENEKKTPLKVLKKKLKRIKGTPYSKLLRKKALKAKRTKRKTQDTTQETKKKTKKKRKKKAKKKAKKKQTKKAKLKKTLKMLETLIN